MCRTWTSTAFLRTGVLISLASVVGRPRASEIDACTRRDLSSWSAGARAAATQGAGHRERRDHTTLAIPLVARERVVGLVEVIEERPRPEHLRRQDGQRPLGLPADRALHPGRRGAGRARRHRTLRLASILESSQAVTGADDLEEALSILTQTSGHGGPTPGMRGLRVHARYRRHRAPGHVGTSAHRLEPPGERAPSGRVPGRAADTERKACRCWRTSPTPASIPPA